MNLSLFHSNLHVIEEKEPILYISYDEDYDILAFSVRRKTSF
jgi:hypothetical protein